MDGNTAIITIGADLAVKKGIVVVNSAGNEGSNGTPNTLTAPADGDSVIAVGAVTSTGSSVSVSAVYGPTVDGRIKPDIMAMGSGVSCSKSL
jgi:serine protease AprX